MIREPKLAAFEQEQGEDDIVKLDKFIARAAEAFRGEGIPVADDGRVDEDVSNRTHAGSYFDIKKKPEETGEAEVGQFGSIAGLRKAERKGPSEDEQLGMLSYAIFLKNLGDKFVVARSSKYDSMNNSASTLILERENGNLVCAFNEVAEVGSERYKRRADFVHGLNLKNGTSLKYGISSETQNGRQNIKLSPAENIPVFYLALPLSQLKGGMKEFLSETDKQSEFEKKLYIFFLASINAQIKGLEIDEERLNPALKNRVAAFKKIIKSQETREDLKPLKKLVR